MTVAGDPRLVTEPELQSAIVSAAMLRGYMVAHFRPASTSKGHRTAIEGHAGFPDLVLARAGAVFAWELKGWQGIARPQLGRPTPEQLVWLEHLAGAVDARTVYPDDLNNALLALELGRWPT